MKPFEQGDTKNMNSAEPTLYKSTMDSPVGKLTIVASDDGVRAVLWPNDNPERVQLGDVMEQPGHAVIEPTMIELTEYFAGDRQVFDVPLDPMGTEFQQSAWHALRSIPYGTTVSYGEQAERMGDKRKARAVGAANGRNPISIIVPCHRVVGAGGELTGFAGGIESKAWLLDHERRVLGVGSEKLF
jgi:methylated-DNA-[protein]-cysteine S-methyltransferase